MSAAVAVFIVLLVLAVGWGAGRDWCQRITEQRDRTSDDADHQRALLREVRRHDDRP